MGKLIFYADMFLLPDRRKLRARYNGLRNVLILDLTVSHKEKNKEKHFLLVLITITVQ